MKIMFEQEVYEHFDYQQLQPWFHTFESDKVVHALSFAHQGEAQVFSGCLENIVKQISGKPVLSNGMFMDAGMS